MDEELKFGMMAPFTRDNGEMTRLTEEEDSFMQMEMYTRESG